MTWHACIQRYSWMHAGAPHNAPAWRAIHPAAAQQAALPHQLQVAGQESTARKARRVVPRQPLGRGHLWPAAIEHQLGHRVPGAGPGQAPRQHLQGAQIRQEGREDGEGSRAIQGWGVRSWRQLRHRRPSAHPAHLPHDQAEGIHVGRGGGHITLQNLGRLQQQQRRQVAAAAGNAGFCKRRSRTHRSGGSST